MKRYQRIIMPTIVLTMALTVWNEPVADAGTFIGEASNNKNAIVVNVSDRPHTNSASASGEDSIAIGGHSRAIGDGDVVIGNRAYTEDSPSGHCVAVGDGAKVNNEYGTALGAGSFIRGEGAVGIGYASVTRNSCDVALGAFSRTHDVTQVSSITIGNTRYAFAGADPIAAVSIGDQYGDFVGTRQLQFVAPGRVTSDSTDGVNGSQLYAVTQAVDYNSGRIDSLSGRVDKVGAGAAALAALHPLDYDADNKLSFASGIGNYAGTSAMAVGAFYRPNDNAMISMAGSMGGGENMVNLGVSFAIGRGTSPYKSKQAMTQTIENLTEKNDRLEAQIDQQGKLLTEQQACIAEQADQIAEQGAMIAKLIAKVEALADEASKRDGREE